MGPAAASQVVNGGSIDEVFAQVLAALAPTLKQQSSTPAAAATTVKEVTTPKSESKAKEKKDEGESPFMFGGLLLTGTLAHALRKAGVRHPTEVQEVALPRIKRGACVRIVVVFE